MTANGSGSAETSPLSQRIPLTPWMTASGMDWSELTAGLSPEVLPKGGILYRQGSASDEMFLIVEGRARLECCHSSGKNRAIYIVSDGVTIGEAGAMFGGAHDFQAVAVSRCAALAGRSIRRAPVGGDAHQPALHSSGDGGPAGGVPRLGESVPSGVHPAGADQKVRPVLSHLGPAGP